MALGSSGRRIVVEFIGDASALRSATRDGEAALSGFSGKAQAAGRIAGMALAGGLLLAGAAAVKATQAAADDEAAQSQLAQQLRQAAGASDGQIAATERWITAQGKATGISDDELRPALARLATATGSVSEAQRLASLAMDVSAGSGKSYQQVTEALAKAQNGNIGALGRLGIATKDAQGHTKTLTQITQDLADKYNGAAAKAADTTAGKQKIMATQFKELQEQIGTKLIPVMTKLAEAGLKVIGFISDNTKAVGLTVAAFAGLLTVTWAVGTAMGIYAAVTGAATAETVLQKVAVGAATVAQYAWAAATKVVAAGQWLLNAALSANPIGLVVIAVAALVAGLILAYKHSETFRNIVNAAFGAVARAAGAAVDFIREHWKLILAILTGPIGIAVGLIAGHWDKIKLGAQLVIGWIKDHWPPLRDAIVDPIQHAKDSISNVWDNIKAGFGVVRDKLKEIAGNIRDDVVNAFDAMKAPIQNLIDKVQWLFDKLGDLAAKVKSLPDIPGIPGLAKGGVVSKPTLAMIGEAGPEAVVPLDRLGAVGPAASASTSPAPVVNNFYIQALTPLEAGKAVEDVLRRREREFGRQLLASPR